MINSRPAAFHRSLILPLSGLLALVGVSCTSIAEDASALSSAEGYALDETETGSSEDAGEGQEDGEAGAEGETASEGTSGEADGEMADLPEDVCREVCDPWLADSCGADRKCVPSACSADRESYDAFVCRPILGEAPAGAECQGDWQGHDDCQGGLVCWERDETGEGHCEPMCTGSSDYASCEEGRVCARFGAVELALCVPTCNPLAIECPASDAACLPVAGSTHFGCVPNEGDGSAGYGSTCEFLNACDPGFMCVSGSAVPEPACAEASGCCSPFCTLEGDNICPGAELGQQCLPIDASLMPEANGLGIGICSML